MPFDIAERETVRQKEHIVDHLNRSYLIRDGNEYVALCAMHNALARLPKYEYIKTADLM
ncbi:MAG: hypothetical protein FWC93_06585 [Defluviitaleaceae bacterium]|nr:hypothetical protein [Defluviitaleaceae bacterium]